MRMADTRGGFVIAAAQTTDGRTLMVASQCVRDIEIIHDHNDPLYAIRQWGGQAVTPTRAPQSKIIASLSPHEQQMVHLNVEHGGYPEAWRRLFNFWTPPQFTDETRAQILTHYTFGA